MKFLFVLIQLGTAVVRK